MVDIRLAGIAPLVFMVLGGEVVGLKDQLAVGSVVVGLDFGDDFLDCD
ncbi:hypothetical protein SDC9_194055 [bioreactor metagenome]|uniref:Uncharacterized protein n=1 Tax=bioreactor metagenome TaxID=1076179 RepID=A0A645I7V2_9ZZZZ